jgi:hypothetical protein
MARLVTIDVGFIVVAELGRLLMPLGDTFGPEMPRFAVAGTNVDALLARTQCFSASEVAANADWLVSRMLPTLVGTAPRGVNEYYVTSAVDGQPVVWGLLLVGLIALLVRAAAVSVSLRRGIPPVAAFLGLVGLVASGAFVSSCGVRDAMLIRYALLLLLIPVAIAAWYLSVETVAGARQLVVVLLTAWTGWSALQYVDLAMAYAQSPPSTPQSVMADELERRGIRYARAGYWEAHYITFVTNERVIVASGYPPRIFTYDTIVSRAPDVVLIQPNACRGGVPIGSLWLCPHGTETLPVR